MTFNLELGTWNSKLETRNSKLETMPLPFVILERRDSFAIIRLNRPEKLNALSREMILDLSEVFTNLRNDPDLRAIILTGAGDQAFCAGTDITELTGLDRDSARQVS